MLRRRFLLTKRPEIPLRSFSGRFSQRFFAKILRNDSSQRSFATSGPTLKSDKTRAITRTATVQKTDIRKRMSSSEELLTPRATFAVQEDCIAAPRPMQCVKCRPFADLQTPPWTRFRAVIVGQGAVTEIASVSTIEPEESMPRISSSLTPDARGMPDIDQP